MTIRFLCPSGHVLVIDDRLAGKKIRCGLCGKIVFSPTLVRRGSGPPQLRPASARPPVSPSPPKPARPAPPPEPSKPPEPVAAPPALPPPPTVEPPRTPLPVIILEDRPLPLPAEEEQEEEDQQEQRPSAEPPVRMESQEKVSGTFCRNGPPDASHKRCLTPFPRLRIFDILRDWWRPNRRWMPADVCRPTARDFRTVAVLAAVLVAAAVFSLLPVAWLGHFNLQTAPGWARAAVLLAGLQLAYVAWMFRAPDWATVRIVMLVFTVSAAAYGLVMAVSLATPVNQQLMLGLGEVRRGAAAWCAVVLVVMSLATAYCGYLWMRWRRGLREAAS